jgi:hypothetical protein
MKVSAVIRGLGTAIGLRALQRFAGRNRQRRIAPFRVRRPRNERHDAGRRNGEHKP